MEYFIAFGFIIVLVILYAFVYVLGHMVCNPSNGNDFGTRMINRQKREWEQEMYGCLQWIMGAIVFFVALCFCSCCHII